MLLIEYIGNNTWEQLTRYEILKEHLEINDNDFMNGYYKDELCLIKVYIYQLLLFYKLSMIYKMIIINL